MASPHEVNELDMKASEFVEELQTAVPSIQEFLNAGFDQQTAETLRDSFLITEAIHPFQESENALMDLVQHYKTAGKQFAMFSFGDDFARTESYVVIGGHEANLLAYTVESGEVVVIDYYDMNSVFPVAIDQPSFLRVLIELVRFDASCMVGKVPNSDDRKNLFSKLVEIAGGERYAEFYRMTRGDS